MNDKVKEKLPPFFSSKTYLKAFAVVAPLLVLAIAFLYSPLSSAEIVSPQPHKVITPVMVEEMEPVKKEIVRMSETVQPPLEVHTTTLDITVPKNHKRFERTANDEAVIKKLYTNNNCILIAGIPDDYAGKAWVGIVKRGKCIIVQVVQEISLLPLDAEPLTLSLDPPVPQKEVIANF